MAEPARPTSLTGTLRIDIKRWGGVRVGKTGPFWSIGIQQQKTCPLRTSLAAATITSGVMKLAVPFHRPFPTDPNLRLLVWLRVRASAALLYLDMECAVVIAEPAESL